MSRSGASIPTAPWPPPPRPAPVTPTEPTVTITLVIKAADRGEDETEVVFETETTCTTTENPHGVATNTLNAVRLDIIGTNGWANRGTSNLRFDRPGKGDVTLTLAFADDYADSLPKDSSERSFFVSTETTGSLIRGLAQNTNSVVDAAQNWTVNRKRNTEGRSFTA